MKIIAIIIALCGALTGCGAQGTAQADYNYVNLYHYPMDSLGVVCYYYSNVPGALSCVKVSP